MTRSNLRPLIAAWGLGLLAMGALLAAAPPPELGRAGMVAADHRLASEAGSGMLARGGNAVDAVVATALAAGVVQPAGSGIGGGGFAVVVLPDGSSEVLDFREVAPAAATRTMFVEAGAEDASTKGGLAVAVPGEVRGLAELHRRHGSLSWKQVVRPAQDLATRGFAVGHHLGEALLGREDRAPALAASLFGLAAVPREGERVRRTSLGRTLSRIAATGGEAFYSGAIAQDLASEVQRQGGVLTIEDLAAYAPVDREPLVGSYRGWTVVTMPPPSSGGAVLLQALGVLEGLELAELGHNSADTLHLVAETLQHGFADRARYMGDPDRVEIPLERILAPERVAEIQRQLVPGRTFPSDYYGTPLDPGQDAGTQHISVLDGEGMAVSLTTTINTSFGSEVVGPRSGVLLNNEMDDFVARPGEANAYGLVGTEANAVSPGARPLSSMSPTVLLSPDGTQRIVVGASGGPTIITGVLQTVINIVDFDMDPSEAIAAPRIHHQWQPALLFVDEGISLDTERALVARGHEVKRMAFFNSVQVVQRTGTDTFVGASDPRKGGWPAGFSP